jgi:hypothetical protein
MITDENLTKTYRTRRAGHDLLTRARRTLTA